MRKDLKAYRMVANALARSEDTCVAAEAIRELLEELHKEYMFVDALKRTVEARIDCYHKSVALKQLLDEHD